MLASPLINAFDVASGRRAAASTPEAAALVAFARRVLDTRRRSTSMEACPSGARDRLRQLFLDSTAPSLLARLVFDSFAGAPATRSARPASRLLRFAAQRGCLDLRIQPGTPGVDLFLSVSETNEPATRVQVVGTSHTHEVSLDEFGAGKVDGADPDDFALYVYDATGNELFHTPRIPLE